MNKKTINLWVSHNIYLSKKDIKKLKKGGSITVPGISVPVWFYKGTTSEPATEVFCMYQITNFPEDYPITIQEDGFKINLPQGPEPDPVEIESDKTINMDIKRLLDMEPVVFRRNTKTITKDDRVNEVHVIEIKRIEELKKSII